MRDTHSISIDPRFVDDTTNFHLRSTAGSYRGAPFTAPGGGSFVADADLSFCIDAGDPASGYAQESAPNGGRLDLGAFGNTPDASLSPAAPLQPARRAAAGREVVRHAHHHLAHARPVGGRRHGEAGILRRRRRELEQHRRLGGLLARAAMIGTRPACRRERITSCASARRDGTAMDVADAAFEVSASGPRTYYVNDTNTLNDVFCSAPGSAANDGLSAATPKDSIQAILDTYKVAGGDTIKVDTGNYLLGATIVMTTNDVGTAGNPIVIQGSTNGTTLNRQNTSYDAFYLQGAEYVQFRESEIHRWPLRPCPAMAPAANYLRGVEILNCETMANGSHGFNFSYTSNLVISASLDASQRPARREPRRPPSRSPSQATSPLQLTEGLWRGLFRHRVRATTASATAARACG